MTFLLRNNTLRPNNLKTRTAVNAKISVFVVCVEAIIYLLLHDLYGCTLNLSLTSNSFVFLTLKMQKRLEETKSIPLVFLLYLKRKDLQTFKTGSCKNPFLQCVFYWYNLLRWMFFILCGRHYFLWKFIVTLWDFWSGKLLLSLKPVF